MARPGAKKSGAVARKPGGGGGKPWVAFIAGLLFGLLVAGGVYLLKILPTAMELEKKVQAACADGEATGKPPETPATPGTPVQKPVTFDFYNMLPNQQTLAPAQGKTTTQAPPMPPPGAAPGTAPVATLNFAPQTATAPATTTTAAAPVAAPAPPAPVPPPVPAALPPPKPAAVAPPPAAKPAPAPAETTKSRYMLQAGAFATRAEADRRRGELVLSGQSVSVQQGTSNGQTRYRVMVGPFADEGTMKKVQGQLAGMKVDTFPVKAP